MTRPRCFSMVCERLGGINIREMLNLNPLYYVGVEWEGHLINARCVVVNLIFVYHFECLFIMRDC